MEKIHACDWSMEKIQACDWLMEIPSLLKTKKSTEFWRQTRNFCTVQRIVSFARETTNDTIWCGYRRRCRWILCWTFVTAKNTIAVCVCACLHNSCVVAEAENTSTTFSRMSVSTDIKLVRSSSVCRIVMVKILHVM